MTEGKYGEPPEDYVLMKAAEWLGHKKTELPTIPLWWLGKALNYMSGEGEAQAELNKRK